MMAISGFYYRRRALMEEAYCGLLHVIGNPSAAAALVNMCWWKAISSAGETGESFRQMIVLAIEIYSVEVMRREPERFLGRRDDGDWTGGERR